jgi:hypothetical protein
VEHRFFFSFRATAPIWALAYLHESLRFTSVLPDLRHSVGLLGRVIRSSRGLYLYTNTEKRTCTHTNTKLPCPEWDPGFRASEDSTSLRPLGYRDWRAENINNYKIINIPSCNITTRRLQKLNFVICTLRQYYRGDRIQENEKCMQHFDRETSSTVLVFAWKQRRESQKLQAK